MQQAHSMNARKCAGQRVYKETKGFHWLGKGSLEENYSYSELFAPREMKFEIDQIYFKIQ